MNSKRIAVAVFAIAIISGAVIGVPLLYNWLMSLNPPNGNEDTTGVGLASYMNAKQADILAVCILGNSTDIVYPELMEAIFRPQETGEWNVFVRILNDTDPNNPIIYNTTFDAGLMEVTSINNAIYDGLEATTESPDTLDDIGEASIGFGIDVLYTDGTWIQLFTLQSAKGHIMFLNGTYTGTPNPVNPFDSAFIDRDQSWQHGIILEPGTALEGLIAAIHEVFLAHLG